MTITFSQAVTDFEQADLSVSDIGASITGWTAQTGGQVYVAEFTLRTNTTFPVTIQVPENVAKGPSSSSDNNRASMARIVNTNTVAGILIIKRLEGAVVTGGFSVIVDFGECVYGFTRDDVRLTSSLKASVTGFSGSNGSTTYTITITSEKKSAVTDNPLYNGSVSAHVGYL